MNENPAPAAPARRLAERVPGARLTLQRLPGASGIHLWLIDDIRADQRLDDEVVHALTETPPYWCFCWASGQVLADWLLAHPETVAGRVVVDVGAGSGVVAIAAAKAGAARAIACDIDPDARAVALANAAANGVAIEVADDLEHCLSVADLILAADILYDRDNMPLLERFRHRAPVVLADSRVPDLRAPGYDEIAVARATTWPDLDEAPWFNRVRVFRAEPEQVVAV